jgi:hypothetical protein
MINMRNDAGFFLIKTLLILATMIAGYLIISRVMASDEAKEAVETVETVRERNQ